MTKAITAIQSFPESLFEGRVCGCCSQWKSLSEYGNDKRGIDGKRYYCLTCNRAKALAWQNANPEKAQERKKEWRVKNADRQRQYFADYWSRHKEQRLQILRRFKDRHGERIVLNNRKRYYANAEHYKKQATTWARNNPCRVKAIQNNRRARVLGNGGKFTSNEWRALCSKYENRCLCCGDGTSLVADHVIPISKGGRNDIGNIQPLCRTCNSKKGVKCTDYRH